MLYEVITQRNVSHHEWQVCVIVCQQGNLALPGSQLELMDDVLHQFRQREWLQRRLHLVGIQPGEVEQFLDQAP